MPDRHIARSEEHTSELQSPCNLVCRLLLEKKKMLEKDKLPHQVMNAKQHAREAEIPAHRQPVARPLRPAGRSGLLALFPFARFFFNDTATTEIYTLSLHDALPIFQVDPANIEAFSKLAVLYHSQGRLERSEEHTSELQSPCNLVCRLLLEKKK